MTVSTQSPFPLSFYCHPERVSGSISPIAQIFSVGVQRCRFPVSRMSAEEAQWMLKRVQHDDSRKPASRASLSGATS